ncbi:MAG: glycosyltransferase family 4 protein [Endomicrobiales bacterium]|nr:glycosyltransferase family 4 protein [Endomicrobiales bacterium]
MPYKILFISNLIKIGGGERNLLDLVSNLDRDKFAPVVICPEEGPLTEELNKKGIQVIITKFGIAKKVFGFIPVISISTISTFYNIIKNEKIDLINSNSYQGVLFTGIPAKLCKIPLVWTMHMWRLGSGIQGILINYFVSKVIAVSNAVKNYFIANSPVPESKIETVFLGIDTKKYTKLNKRSDIRNEFAVKDNGPLIAIVGRFQAIKGHIYFFEAAKLIKKEVPEIKFMVVGERIFDRKDDKDYPGQIKQIISDFGLENDVIFTGYRTDIPDILSAIDVLVMSSLKETFGLVLLEAMAANIPVVSTRCGGPEDIIEDSASGFLVKNMDPLSISNAVIKVLKNKQLRDEITNNAKNRVEQLFSINTQARKYESIYSSILEKNK